jgi:hypothetical protein
MDRAHDDWEEDGGEGIADNDNEDEDEDDDDNDDDKEEVMKIEDVIVESFIRNFHKGEYDVELDDTLGLDRGVPLPAHPTQASYNKPDNWRERNQIGLERVKEQLQTCIRSAIQEPSFELCLTHNTTIIMWEQHQPIFWHPIVWHEPILDEYWDILEEEFGQNKQMGIVTEIDHIGITSIEITKDQLAALVDIFRSGRATNSSTVVDFNNVNLCGEGIVSLSKLVDVSSELQCFCLRHNPIDNMDSARYLSRSLKSHTRINNIHLDHCDLGSNPKMLSVILQSEIKIIYLSSNNIDSLGAVKIAEYLESDPPIDRIGLNRNRLNDNDAMLISQALKWNTNLSHLDLERNNITSIGVKALLTCVFDSSSLTSISESNHTLERLGLFTRQKNGRLADCIDKLLELNRIDKIILALQDKDSLLKYLANVPVELIPEVLTFPQWVVNYPQHNYLNIVYSTMRWWNMPMLYSYHHSCVKSDTKRKRDK